MESIVRFFILFVRNPALAYGHTGVQVGGLLGVREYRWQQVRDIRETVWKRPYIPFMHWLPKERHYLELEIDADRAVKLRSDMIELPAGGVKEVIEGFRAAQIGALGDRGAAMARLGAKGAWTCGCSGLGAAGGTLGAAWARPGCFRRSRRGHACRADRNGGRLAGAPGLRPQDFLIRHSSYR